MKKNILLKIIIILVILLLILPVAICDLTLNSNIKFSPSTSNCTMRLNTTLSLSDWRINSTSIFFEGKEIRIRPESGHCFVNISTWNPPASIILVINASDTVNFTLGGFLVDHDYDVDVDGSTHVTKNANSTGVIQFNYTSWSNHTFTISPHIDSSPSYGGSTPTIESLDYEIHTYNKGNRKQILIVLNGEEVFDETGYHTVVVRVVDDMDLIGDVVDRIRGVLD